MGRERTARAECPNRDVQESRGTLFVDLLLQQDHREPLRPLPRTRPVRSQPDYFSLCTTRRPFSLRAIVLENGCKQGLSTNGKHTVHVQTAVWRAVEEVVTVWKSGGADDIG